MHHKTVFEQANRLHKFISIDMAEGNLQVGQMEQLIAEYPHLRIAIGHFGMVTVEGWKEQIALAKHEHVYIESGGITWLFTENFIHIHQQSERYDRQSLFAEWIN